MLVGQDDMRRRTFVGLAGATVAWPLMARAQAPATQVIGFLGSETPERTASLLNSFRQGLARPDTTKAATSPSNTAGLRARTIGYQGSRPSWSPVVST
jgi:hypothetical protein